MLRHINLPAILLTVCLFVTIFALIWSKGNLFTVIIVASGLLYSITLHALAKRFNPKAVLLSSIVAFAGFLLFLTIVSFGLLLPSNALINVPCTFEYNPAGGLQVLIFAGLVIGAYPFTVGIAAFLNFLTV